MLLDICYSSCFDDATNKVNILHWSSIKYKQNTYRVSATLIHKIAYECNMRVVIMANLKKML